MLTLVRQILAGAKNRAMFFSIIATFFPELDPRYQAILRAYNAAKDAFRNKPPREDGKRYFEHLRAVALILILYLRVRDYELIIAALLHDIVEDCPEWSLARVRAEFGDRVALLLDWLSKRPVSELGGSKEKRDAFYHGRFHFAPREFFLIKLCDRLHNLLELWACPIEKQIRKIAETRAYYLPYAEEHQILIHELEAAMAELEAA